MQDNSNKNIILLLIFADCCYIIEKLICRCDGIGRRDGLKIRYVCVFGKSLNPLILLKSFDLYNKIACKLKFEKFVAPGHRHPIDSRATPKVTFSDKFTQISTYADVMELADVKHSKCFGNTRVGSSPTIGTT